jgi:hypothetical protein
MERAVVPAPIVIVFPLASGRFRGVAFLRRSFVAPQSRRRRALWLAGPAARYGVAEGLGVGDKSAVTLTLDRALCRCAAVLAVGVGGGK